MMHRVLTYLMACSLACSLAGPSSAGDLTVFAAASLRDALDEVAKSFEAETGQTVVLSYAGSSALARQIQQGAPADIFLSANPEWMDVLENEGLLESGTRIDLLGNSLVLVSADDVEQVELTPDSDLLGWLNGGKLAMALVDAVPAGRYGRGGLEHLGLWDGVAPHVAQADNVRAALALVSLGAAPLGVVYATDIQAEPRVSIHAVFPEGSHPPITYPVAALANARRGSDDFLGFLTSDTASNLFESYGFKVLAD